ncbi:MAG: 4Fe-4S binding protein [Clostridiales bacterium]|nr:4Fe-4S binding protein [Clostridiales bacterium]
MDSIKSYVLICGGANCTMSHKDEIVIKTKMKIKEASLETKVQVLSNGCFGLCDEGPIFVVYPEGVFYSHVQVSDIDEIVEKHLLNGEIVDKLLYKGVIDDDAVTSLADSKIYKNQTRIVLKNCGVINPENIDEYIAYDGYMALGKVLSEMTPEKVVEVIRESGLRGRGGGGFPTGVKWGFAAKATGKQKYVLCNADEGDPGAFMDRSVLEGDPHSVIEAMAIAGYAIGGSQGYIYIRAEYPLAIKRLEIAIDQAREYGLLGNNIFGSDFSFDVELRLGAGAFICGEETALIASIEGERGMPRNKPPFPAIEGLWGMPTILNNVETYANIAQIILNGVDWFRSIGTERSPGTKVFALGGKINNTGLVEIPIGTKLREIIYDIGGGIPNGKKFKAVQTGGPSGGCITSDHLDIGIDYETLIELGSMMGSGGMIVMDEDNCMVDIARFFLDFTVDESCGKCTPCREGTKRMLEMLEKITAGNGVAEDLVKLEKLAYVIKDTALCGLGQTAPNPVLSTLKYYRDEYEAHVFEKRCPAGYCKELIEFNITDECKGCSKCISVCPVEAISGVTKGQHIIDPNKCIKCGECLKACPFGAIIKE